MWHIPAGTAYGGILLTRGGRILLREQANHYDGYVWTFAKGRPDLGEIPEQAALREVREETSYDREAVEQFENPEDQEKAEQALQALYHFAVQAFMRTQMLWSPGKTLKDFRPAA